MSDYKTNIPGAVAQIVAAYATAKSPTAVEICNMTEALAQAFLIADGEGDKHAHEVWRELQDAATTAREAAKKK